MEYVYVKNNFLNKADASVSLNDRGFKFGDGAFETIRISRSKPYQLAFHLTRLKMALCAIKIHFAHLEEIENLVYEIIKLNNIFDGFVRVYITRGEASFGYLPLPSASNLYIQSSALDNSKIENLITDGVKLHISKYENISIKALPRKYKLAQGLNSTLARLDAIENGCFESLMLNQEQYISDCSSSNIFLCMKDRIITPDIDSGAMNGCIRNIILSNMSRIFNIVETQVTLSDLMLADAVFITNVSWLVLEVTSVPDIAKEYSKSPIVQDIRKMVIHDLEGINA